MDNIKIYIQRLEHGNDLPLPDYMTSGASGVDLFAAVDKEHLLEPGERSLIPTGIKIALPEGYEAQLRPRSGLAIKYGVTLLNTPGTIDSDYRGEIKVILINLGDESFLINRGDRIAQMILQEYKKAIFIESTSLPGSSRDEGGFGHTGRK